MVESAAWRLRANRDPMGNGDFEVAQWHTMARAIGADLCRSWTFSMAREVQRRASMAVICVSRARILSMALLACLGCSQDNVSPSTDAEAFDARATATMDGGSEADRADENELDSHVADVIDARDVAEAGDAPDHTTGEAGQCTAPLTTSGCPGSYGDALNSALTCHGWPNAGIDGGYPWFPSASLCGSFALVAYYGGTFGTHSCYYDVDAGTLVGAEYNSDYAVPPCNGVTSAGQVPASCGISGDPLDASCLQIDAAADSTADGPDAGSD